MGTFLHISRLALVVAACVLSARPFEGEISNISGRLVASSGKIWRLTLVVATAANTTAGATTAWARVSNAAATAVDAHLTAAATANALGGKAPHPSMAKGGGGGEVTRVDTGTARGVTSHIRPTSGQTGQIYGQAP